MRCRAAAEDEDDIEAIERRLKGKRSKPKEGYFDSYPTKPANADYPPGLWESDPALWDSKARRTRTRPCVHLLLQIA